MSGIDEEEEKRPTRQSVAWILGVALVAVLLVGGGFLLGLSRWLVHEGAIAVIPLVDERGMPVREAPVDGLLVLFAHDVAAAAELDVRYPYLAAQALPDTLPRRLDADGDIRFTLGGTAHITGSRLVLHLRITDIRAGKEVWSDSVEAEGQAVFPALAEAGRKLAFLLRRNEDFRHGRTDPPDPVSEAMARMLLAAAAWFPDLPNVRAWANISRLHDLADELAPTDVVITAGVVERLARGVMEGYLTGTRPLERAADLLARAGTAAPDNAEVLLARCYLAQARAQNEEAVGICEAALVHERVRARAAVQLANAQLELWHADLASDWYRRALEAPDSGAERRFALRGLGVSQYVQGQPDAAIKSMTQAVQVQPDDPVAQGWLVALLVLAGREDEARRQARVFHAIPGDAARPVGTMRRVYLLSPEYDGRNGLVQGALARVRPDARRGSAAPVR